MDETENLIMWTVEQIAARDRLSKQAVSKAVLKFLADGREIPVERDIRGRVKSLSLAHYDHHREQFTNPAKSARRVLHDGTGDSAAPMTDSFDEARRQREWLNVGRERVRVRQAIGELLRSDKVAEAISDATRQIKQVLSRLPDRAPEPADAVAKEGAHGARAYLRDAAFQLCNDIADRFAALEASAPETDALIELDGAQ